MLHGQTTSDERIRLMSDALAARDAGNLEVARNNLLELLQLSPGDPGLQRLLENVETNLQSQSVTATVQVTDVTSSVGRISDEQRRQLDLLVEESRARRGLAKEQLAQGEYASAIETLSIARTEVPKNALTANLHSQLEQDQGEAYLQLVKQQLDSGDLVGARQTLDSYADLSPDSRRSERTIRNLERELVSPARLPIEEASPGFLAEQEEIRRMIRVGRAQFLNGDLLGAENTFRQVEATDVYNSEAKSMLARIAEEKRRRNHLDRTKTRTQMLEEIGGAWQRPQIYVNRPKEVEEVVVRLPLENKLNEIRIPSVNFAGVELSRAINTLSQVSAEYDPAAIGVNIVPMDPNRTEPLVYMNVRDLSLKRILDLMVDSVSFQYDIEPDAVIVRPGIRRRPDLETENFPVSAATIQRMMGRSSPPQASAAMDDPFAPPPAGPQGGGGGANTSGQLRNFLQQAAGVDFSVAGSSLIYDGTDVWVTQTTRNLERIRNVFRRLTDVRQVEIEARFLEVTESAVDELGFDWQVVSPGGNASYRTQNRSLAGAFAGSQGASEIRVGDISVPISPPTIPGAAAMGAGATSVALIDGSVDGFDVRAAVRMLSQRTGSDLLSAPKLTVLSGHQATINVAQEIRYPDSYGDTQSDVGRGGTGDAGAAGVTITPGTPQDFQMRRVGVELTVTPTVEQDNSVTLDLNPRVTEFEGFVEFGGVGLAISGGQVVTIPSGFYQPVFATRELNTKVNIWDGATVVMGGLTREDVRRVSDKTPFLGDIPVLGRFFRSEGEGSQKRNLLVFVTANLVSPGGSPMRQQLRNVEPGALYQNPTVVLPGGAVAREKREE
jgi:general secretion pathway protein D